MREEEKKKKKKHNAGNNGVWLGNILYGIVVHTYIIATATAAASAHHRLRHHCLVVHRNYIFVWCIV